jgi:hypothetical protein
MISFMLSWVITHPINVTTYSDFSLWRSRYAVSTELLVFGYNTIRYTTLDLEVGRTLLLFYIFLSNRINTPNSLHDRSEAST